ncbi:MAG: hypothetical protein WCT14_07880 [Treponemataceae bacterium]
MRAVARLTLLYSAAFIFFLTAGTGISVMRTWLEATQAFPLPAPFHFMRALFSAVSENVPLAVYGSVLLTLPAASRRLSGSLSAQLMVFMLTSAVLFSVTYGTHTFSNAAESTQESMSGKKLGTSGLIINLGASTIVFAGTPNTNKDEYAVDIAANSKLRIIPTGKADELIKRSGRVHPLGSFIELNPSLASISSDFSAGARRLSATFDAGALVLLAYSCALALLLSSFGVLSGATRWPLADLALCALALRGALIFEGIVSSPSVIRFVMNGNIGIPEPFIVPAILGSSGLLIFAGGFVSHFALGRIEKHG